MCLGIPGRVTEIRDEGGLAMGKVDFGGVRKDACLAYLPRVEVGDYVIVHVGFAISRLDEEEALRTLEILDMMGVIEPELATLGPGMTEPAVLDEDITFGTSSAPSASSGVPSASSGAPSGAPSA
ncbi:MAG: HypC/HybG/HupF family hydrogenase formation chaperone [Chloroflexota bacterium]